MKNEITQKDIEAFKSWLKQEERSQGTIEKYLRDLKAFFQFLPENTLPREAAKESLTAWKEYLIRSEYAVVTINSMLTAVNGFFRFVGWEECRVRPLKMQSAFSAMKIKNLPKRNTFVCSRPRRNREIRDSIISCRRSRLREYEYQSCHLLRWNRSGPADQRYGAKENSASS